MIVNPNTRIMKTFGILIALLTLLPVSVATNCITVEGIVVDAATGDPLSNCNVYLEGTDFVAQTEKDGTFLVRVPDNYYSNVLVAWTKGYEKFFMPLSKIDGEYVIIKLKETALWMKEEIREPVNHKSQGYAMTASNVIILKRKPQFRIVF